MLVAIDLSHSALRDDMDHLQLAYDALEDISNGTATAQDMGVLLGVLNRIQLSLINALPDELKVA